MWMTFATCRDEDYVNCTFAGSGECLNPRHNPNVNRAKQDIREILLVDEDDDDRA